MADLLEILNDPNYVNANLTTKNAIFQKYAPLDENYSKANNTTQLAIKDRFGVGGLDEFGDSPNAVKEVFSNAVPSLLSGLGGLAQFPGKLADLVTGTAPDAEPGLLRKGIGAFLPFASTGARGAGERLEEFGKELKTPTLRRKEKERAAAVEAAEGELNKFKVAGLETITDPSLLGSFLFEQAPNALGSAGVGLLTKAGLKLAFKNSSQATLNAAGTGASIATQVAQQGTDVGYDTYKYIYDELVKGGMSKEQANSIAIDKGRVAALEGGAISYALSRIPGAREFEKMLFKNAAKAGVSPSTFLQGARRGAVGGGTSEIGEEVGGKFASNVGVQEVFPGYSLSTGVGETAAMAGIGGSTTSGVFGGLNARAEAKAIKQNEEAIAKANAPFQYIEPQTNTTMTASVTELDDPNLVFVGTQEVGGRQVYVYAPTEGVGTAEAPVTSQTAPEGNVAQSREQMMAEVEGRQLPLAQVNPEGTVLPAPIQQTAQAQPPAGQLSLAPVNPEGTVIAPAKPVDPNVKAQLAAVEPNVEAMIPNEPPPAPIPKPAPIVQEKRVAAEPTARYGITDTGETGVPLTEGGKPFKTRKEAEDIQKLQRELRILPVKVKGNVTGYVLADKTEKQLAAEKVAAKRLQAVSVGGLLGGILRKGGINPIHRAELGFDEKENPSFGNRRLFAAEGKGISLSEITEGQEEGKVAEDRFTGRDIDFQNSLSDRIKDELDRYNSGKTEVSVIDRYEQQLDAEQAEFDNQEAKAMQRSGEPITDNALFQDYYDVEINLENPEQSMLDAGYTQQDLNVVGFTKASPELKAEVAALEAQMKALGLETADILAEIAFTPNITNLEYYTRAKSKLTKAITQATKQGSDNNIGKVNVPPSSAGIENPAESLDQFLAQNGFTFLPDDSARNFQDFATFEKDGVRVALSNNALGYSKNRVMMITPFGKFSNSLTVQALIVDAASRNQGKAKEAMQLLIDRADQTNTTLYVEPLPINDTSVKTEGLKKFYSSLGFEPKGEKIMVREPSQGITSPTEAGLKAKQDAIDKAAAEKAKADREAAAKDKAETDRKAIAAASEKSAGKFELGKTAEEDLSGQKDIFAIADKVGIPPEMQAPADFVLKEGRIKEVVLAAQALADGKITKAEYDRYVDFYAPIATIPNPEPPLDTAGMKRVLKSNQVSQINPKIAEGTRVGIRMDINALKRSKKISEDTGTKVSGSVVSIHEGSDLAKQGTIIGYSGVASIKNAKFAIRNEQAAFKVAQNLEAKSPQQTIEGEWVNITPEDAYARVQSLLKDPNWAQVSLDPLRHSFFYDRSNKQPVTSADEILQIGRFVLAKNVKYAPRESFLYSKTSAQPSAGDRAKVLSVAQSVSADWAIVPDVVVVDNMQSDAIPSEVKDYDKTQTGGTTKNPAGFYYRGKIYLLASQLKDEKDIVRVMNHEVLGHYGLRGLFGEALTPILDQLATARRDLVQERADAYGLDMNNQNDRRQAAEEALAILAQTRPELGFVKRAVAAIRTWLREHGFKNLKLTDDQIINDYIIPARNFIERGTQSPSEQLNDIRYSKSGASLQKPKPAASWDTSDLGWGDTFIGYAQDRHISLKRVQQAIEKLPTVTELQDNLNAYRLEDLAHGRVQDQKNKFLQFEFDPILKEMNANKVTDEQLTEYLWNRHAPEANDLIAKRNPNNPAMQDKGSGKTYKESENYFKALDPARKKIFESIAKKVDKIITGTQDLLNKNGLISAADAKGWSDAFRHYVPLRREVSPYVLPASSVKQIGAYSKSRTGSHKAVTDILSNIGVAREIAIVRAEKEKAKRAVYGLFVMYPNTDIAMAVSPAAVKNEALLMQELAAKGWDPADVKNIMAEPTKAYFNKETGLVEHKINTQLRYAEFVLPLKMNGEDRFVFFNLNNKRALHIITALKNADTQKLNVVNSYVGNLTRYFAAVNTQYNLVFGVWNFARDVQGAMLNLTTTPLNGKQVAVAKGTLVALKDIYAGIKANKKSVVQTQAVDGSWQDFLEAGGKIGFMDQFTKLNDTSTLVDRELKKLNRGNVYKAAKSALDWVSNVNDMLENAVRLSAYRVALQQNLSKDKAAEIAKNLTVNFNRKGSATAGFAAYYAFFNAAVQASVRTAKTLDPRTKLGKSIIAGGLALGMAQSLMLMAAGFEDDEPSEFLKERNFIIPTGWLTGERTYAMWPYPLGFNILPNTGRLLIDGAARLGDGKGVGDIAMNALSMVVSSTNPLGGNAATLQSYTPTIADPIIAAFVENKDAFGRPISKEDRGLQPTPGYKRSREPTNPFFQGIAEFLNNATSRDKDVKGFISPTADQLSYIAEQVGGGVYREISRAVKYAINSLNGEETPEHQVPIAGKIVGNLESNAAISQKFYTNIKNMAEHEDVIKARRGRRESTSEYMRDNPEARLWQRANTLENEITKLNKNKKELYQREASQERIKRVEDQKVRMMKQFNDQVRRVN